MHEVLTSRTDFYTFQFHSKSLPLDEINHLGAARSSFSGWILPKWHHSMFFFSSTHVRSVSVQWKVSRKVTDWLLLDLKTVLRLFLCFCSCMWFTDHSELNQVCLSNGMTVITLQIICTDWWKACSRGNIWRCSSWYMFTKVKVNPKTQYTEMYTNTVTDMLYSECVATAVLWQMGHL